MNAFPVQKATSEAAAKRHRPPRAAYIKTHDPAPSFHHLVIFSDLPVLNRGSNRQPLPRSLQTRIKKSNDKLVPDDFRLGSQRRPSGQEAFPIGCSPFEPITVTTKFCPSATPPFWFSTHVDLTTTVAPPFTAMEELAGLL